MGLDTPVRYLAIWVPEIIFGSRYRVLDFRKFGIGYPRVPDLTGLKYRIDLIKWKIYSTIYE